MMKDVKHVEGKIRKIVLHVSMELNLGLNMPRQEVGFTIAGEILSV